jgi:hypothetical protein
MPAEYKLVPEDKSYFIKSYSKRTYYRHREVIISTIMDIFGNKEAQHKLLRTIIETEERREQDFPTIYMMNWACLSALKLSLQSLANQNDYNKRELINTWNMCLMKH